MSDRSLGLRVLEAIVQELEIAAQGPDAPEGVRVWRNRLRPLERTEDREVLVYTSPGIGTTPPESVESASLGPDGTERRRRQIVIELRQKLPYAGAAAISLEEALDEIYVWVVRTICGAGRLGGLLVRTPREEAVQWDWEETSQSIYALAAVTMAIEYETVRGDPAGEV